MLKLSFILFFFSCTALFLVFVGYPLILFLYSKVKSKDHLISEPDISKKVSIIMACAGDLKLLKPKIENFLALDYPEENLELVVCFDGSARADFHSGRIKSLSLEKQMGKAYALNRAVSKSSGQFLLFTDADAIFSKEAVKVLLRHFNDPEIGGVWGKRKILEKRDSLTEAQSLYISLDNFIKKYESKIGSTTANDGKIYMIRKECFKPIDPKSTDDLYTALGIIRKGKRFIYDEKAVACIKRPSRSFIHEIKRRKRIVSRSMRAIWLNRELLNPFRYGIYSFGLFVNKVLRRAIGFFLILIFLTSLTLINSPFFKTIFFAQTSIYVFLLFHPVFKRLHLSFLEKLTASGLYFIAGCMGCISGIFSFLIGEVPEKWEPIKE